MVGETFNIAADGRRSRRTSTTAETASRSLEEAYTFRFDPPEGFGFQAVERPGDRKPS
jgi:5-deoxy-D-glucuronate isomerase